jgi:hypothetical protein
MFSPKIRQTLVGLLLTVGFLLAAAATALPCGPLAGGATR